MNEFIETATLVVVTLWVTDVISNSKLAGAMTKISIEAAPAVKSVIALSVITMLSSVTGGQLTSGSVEFEAGATITCAET